MQLVWTTLNNGCCDKYASLTVHLRWTLVLAALFFFRGYILASLRCNALLCPHCKYSVHIKDLIT